jgi:uncharacterized membrane protein
VTVADMTAIVQAIRRLEARSSAEVRVHLDRRCSGDPQARAVALFERLGMHRTALRNGVLIYVAVADRRLAVIGDRGIHERVGAAYWQGLAATLSAHFRDGRAGAGLLAALGDLERVLAVHFPRRPDDRNELADDVSLA